MEKKEIKNIFAQKQEHIASKYDKYFPNRLFYRYVPGIIVESLYVIVLMILAFFICWFLLRWF